MICEKCWSDAYIRSLGTGKSQYDCYLELLAERKDNPCPPEAQSNNAPASACALHADRCSGLEAGVAENKADSTSPASSH